MNKFYILGAILCGTATIVSASRDNSLSFLLFLFFTAAFLFMLTDK
jgi:NADH:ubiquinone oxidoreductase subunit 6 (subunit J)